MWIAGDGDHWGPSWIMVITGSRCSLYRFSRSPPFSVPLLSRLPQILFSLSEGLRGWTGLLLMIFFSGRSALTFVCRAIFHSSVLLHFYMSQFDFTDHLQPHLIRHSSSASPKALSEHLNERVLWNATELSRSGPVSSARTFRKGLVGRCGFQPWLEWRGSGTYVSPLQDPLMALSC